MTFQNTTNPNNNDFQQTSGVFEFADRTRMVAGYTENLGLTYTGSVLSVTGADSALSSTNPGYVILSSKSSPGVLKKYKITADQGFIDDTGASEIIGNLFGTTTGIAWANILPFFVYAVSNDAENAIAFMICRVPHTIQSPVAADIGAPDDPVADNEEAFFSFENIDETLYESNPCRSIGSFRMTKTSADDWTVTALSTSDGIGFWQENRDFTMPLSQNGAAIGSYLKANGGTAPLFDRNQYYYYIDRHGLVIARMNIRLDPGGDGAGAVSAQIALPLIAATSAGTVGNSIGVSALIVASATGGEVVAVSAPLEGTTSCFMLLDSSTFVQNADFSNGGRTISGTVTYTVKGLP